MARASGSIAVLPVRRSQPPPAGTMFAQTASEFMTGQLARARGEECVRPICRAAFRLKAERLHASAARLRPRRPSLAPSACPGSARRHRSKAALNPVGRRPPASTISWIGHHARRRTEHPRAREARERARGEGGDGAVQREAGASVRLPDAVVEMPHVDRSSARQAGCAQPVAAALPAPRGRSRVTWEIGPNPRAPRSARALGDELLHQLQLPLRQLRDRIDSPVTPPAGPAGSRRSRSDRDVLCQR